jgi:hypothetical protein
MSEAKHTPGPWEVPTASLTSVWHGDEQVASCHWTIECPNCGDTDPDYRAGRREFDPSGVRQANARLIAAAPDLLAACRVALIDASWGGTDATRRQLQAAIAKAEGR